MLQCCGSYSDVLAVVYLVARLFSTLPLLLCIGVQSLKPGSQYNVNVTLRQEVIQFSMGLVAGIEMISIPATVAATNPLKIV